MSGAVAVEENGKISLITPRAVFFLWLGAFAYSLIAGVVLQTLLLPMLPSMHAGHGLMFGDAIFFHEQALWLVAQIESGGWGEWRLVPSAATTANVGVLAALYAFFGPEPLLFLPLNAAFHALGTVLVLLVALQLFPDRVGLRGGLLAALVFLIFPSALVWYGQNHKDAFAIAGFLLVLLAFLRALDWAGGRALLSNVLMFVAGFFLVSIMRPHLPFIYLIAFGGAFLIVAFFSLVRCDWNKRRGLLAFAGLLLLGVALLPVVPVSHGLVEGGADIVPGYNSPVETTWAWQESSYLPRSLDGLLHKVASVRVYFIGFGQLSEAGSGIDESVRPQNAEELVFYLPRALQVGVFAPFPSFWVERLSPARVVGALETLAFYLFFPGVLVMLWRRMSRGLFICLSVALAVIMINAVVSPNLGTLHRVRFGQWFIFMIVGACGWVTLWDWVAARFVTREHSGPVMPSGSKAASAGFMVMLISLLGFIGLLIRDLLLIDRVGFGQALDSYYLAMMLPVFFTGILAVPLGDALSTRIVQLAEHFKVKGLLRAVSSLTLLLFILISTGLLLFTDQIFAFFVADGDVSLVRQLFPMALLLLVFSGLLVTGNSLVNSLGRPVLAAAGQLAVPVVVILVVLLADGSRAVSAAMLGMVLGQLVNLAVLSVLLWRYGFNVVPGSLAPLRGESEMLHNVKWLALCALLTGVAVPVNYWFAGSIGVGAVSTWALGSKLIQVSSVIGAALMTAVFVPYMSKVVAAGVRSRIRDDLFTSLIVGGWGSVVVVMAVFIFAEPLIYTGSQGVEQEHAAEVLITIVKLGALQLPFVMSSILLFKLCAVSSGSLKAVVAALVGLLVNVLLNILLVPQFGLVGLAMAWTLSSLVTTLVIMAATREHSHLSVRDAFMVLATWLMLGVLAAALHFHSLLGGLVATVLAGLLMFYQLRLLSQQREHLVSPS